MYSKTVTITNPTGLHARPASDFVRAAKRFSSAVTVRRLPDGKPVNAKSIVMVMSLGAESGARLEISADGADERNAADALAELAESGFPSLS